jgi:hypothetical protein
VRVRLKSKLTVFIVAPHECLPAAGERNAVAVTASSIDNKRGLARNFNFRRHAGEFNVAVAVERVAQLAKFILAPGKDRARVRNL